MNRRFYYILCLGLSLLIPSNSQGALPCQFPTLQLQADCINNYLKELSVYDTDPNNSQSVPILVFKGVNIKIQSNNNTDGTGNLIIGDDHTYQNSTSGFIAGKSNTISSYPMCQDSCRLN